MSSSHGLFFLAGTVAVLSCHEYDLLDMVFCMKQERIKSKRFQGVYHRLSTNKKHLGKPDRVFWVKWTENGKPEWERVGAVSEGVTEEYAYQRRVEILSQLHAGEIPSVRNKRKAMTLEQAMTAYIDWRKGEGKDTYSDESRHRKHVRPFFGDITIAQITPEMLDKFKAAMLACQAPSSTKKLFGVLRSAVNLAVSRKKFIGANPFSVQKGSTFTLPKEDNEGLRFLTRGEARALLEELEIRSQQLHDMAFIALYTGLRATEIFGLTGADIDEANKIAHIRAKGGDREVVLLQDEVLSVLRKYRTTPEALLFQKRGGGRHGAISTAFRRAVDAIGLNDGVTDKRRAVWFHSLRHTFASWLAQSGKVGLHELMRFLRHKNIEMTLRYAHLLPDKQREHLAIIGEIMSSPDQ
ncbi:tyrosine-type recombinase/integrase [Desulfovibrio sp. OttesenSCG-928-G11]|nr:tyrosine-type recombinase/integrase [Desulfovibrio sp. OttesenSCG-928-G11]